MISLKPLMQSTRNAFVDLAFGLRTLNIENRRPRKRAYVLYLFADRKKYPHARDAVERLIRRMPGYDVTLIAIDNFGEGRPAEQISPTCFEMGGDNTQWEFSGWQVGLDFIRRRGFDCDVVLFVNDSFLNKTADGYDFDWYAHSYNTIMLDRVTPLSALGRIWKSEGPHRIRGIPVPYYLQTHFFALGVELCRELAMPFVKDAEANGLLPLEWDGKWFTESALINEEMKDDIIRHLTSVWKFKRSVGPDTWPILRGKTVAMLNERLLMTYLQSKNARILGLDGKRNLLGGHMRVAEYAEG